MSHPQILYKDGCQGQQTFQDGLRQSRVAAGLDLRESTACQLVPARYDDRDGCCNEAWINPSLLSQQSCLLAWEALWHPCECKINLMGQVLGSLYFYEGSRSHMFKINVVVRRFDYCCLAEPSVASVYMRDGSVPITITIDSRLHVKEMVVTCMTLIHALVHAYTLDEMEQHGPR